VTNGSSDRKSHPEAQAEQEIFQVLIHGDSSNREPDKQLATAGLWVCASLSVNSSCGTAIYRQFAADITRRYHLRRTSAAQERESCDGYKRCARVLILRPKH
jgi:hypothetical protein